MKGKLSERQQGILEFIRNFMDEHQFPPTVRDIQAGCDISSTSVVDYNLHILQREGYLRRLPEVSRGIELLDGSRGIRRDTVSVPIIGSIAAGEPLHIPAAGAREVDEYETIDLPPFLMRGKSEVYGLRVKGESMIDAFIADGDLVLMEPTTQARTGEMVAAVIADRDEVTLKRFFLEGDTVRLQPENPTMEPIIIPAAHVAVRGRVVGVIRSY
jgi:repressor LexA